MVYRYFGRFPQMAYDGRNITDITRRIKFVDLAKSNAVGYESYLVKDGETPETIAFKYYGDAGYHWLILIINEIINPFFGWPLKDDDLKTYVKGKYGAGNEYAVHHYIPSSLSTLPADTILDATADPAERQPVTNYEHETNENENKRAIKLIRREFLQLLTDEFQKKIIL